MQKLIELAAGLGLEVRMIDQIPGILNHRAGDTLHLGNVIWVERRANCKSGMLVHEISHWLLASEDARRGWNFSSRDSDYEAHDVEQDVCLIDMFLLTALGMRSTAYRWSTEETHILDEYTLTQAALRGGDMWPYQETPLEMRKPPVRELQPKVVYEFPEGYRGEEDVRTAMSSLGVSLES